MQSLKITLDLTKFKNTIIQTSKTGKQYICLPIVDNDIFFSEKTKALYLHLIAFENQNKQYNDYSIKQQAKKDATEQERKELPFVGNIVENKPPQPKPQDTAIEQTDIKADDLPF